MFVQLFLFCDCFIIYNYSCSYDFNVINCLLLEVHVQFKKIIIKLSKNK